MKTDMMDDVLKFWFDELTPQDWFTKSVALDDLIRTRFGDCLKQVQHNECDHWRNTAKGSLAEVIVLDQFTRNIFRDTPAAFAGDAQALALAQVAISKGFDQMLAPNERRFLYMPFMHSESRAIHDRAVTLFTALGDANTLDFEIKHKVIIDRFGRYPHRNAILGRQSTPEELAFLAEPNSSF